MEGACALSGECNICAELVSRATAFPLDTTRLARPPAGADDHMITRLFLRGSMTVVDDLGQHLTLDKTNGELYDAEGEPFDDVGLNKVAIRKSSFPYNQHGDISMFFVDVRTSSTMQKMWD